jgi:hypothetical protein
MLRKYDRQDAYPTVNGTALRSAPKPMPHPSMIAGLLLLSAGFTLARDAIPLAERRAVIMQRAQAESIARRNRILAGQLPASSCNLSRAQQQRATALIERELQRQYTISGSAGSS